MVDGQTVALAQVRHDARRDRLLADAEVHLAADPPFAPELGEGLLEVTDARHLAEQSSRVEAVRGGRPHYEPPSEPTYRGPSSDPAVRKGSIGIDSSLSAPPAHHLNPTTTRHRRAQGLTFDREWTLPATEATGC